MTDPGEWSIRDSTYGCPTDGCGLLEGHPHDCEPDMGAPTPPTDELGYLGTATSLTAAGYELDRVDRTYTQKVT